jgi:hypothetical protein
MNQLTKKQFRKAKTLFIANQLHAGMLSEDQAPTMEDTKASFPKVSHYKSADTGEVRVGLSLRGIRKLVKIYPLITPEAVRFYFNMDPL